MKKFEVDIRWPVTGQTGWAQELKIIEVPSLKAAKLAGEAIAKERGGKLFGQPYRIKEGTAANLGAIRAGIERELGLADNPLTTTQTSAPAAEAAAQEDKR